MPSSCIKADKTRAVWDFHIHLQFASLWLQCTWLRSFLTSQLRQMPFPLKASDSGLSPLGATNPKIKSLLSGHKWPQSAVMIMLLHRSNMERHLGVRRRILGSLLQIMSSEISRHWFSSMFSEVLNFHCHWSDCHLRYHQSLRPLSLIGNLFWKRKSDHFEANRQGYSFEYIPCSREVNL